MTPFERLAAFNNALREQMKLVIWPYMGVNVERGIQTLIDQGFTREEAEYFLIGLTALQMARMGWQWSNVYYDSWEEEEIFEGTR